MHAVSGHSLLRGYKLPREACHAAVYTMDTNNPASSYVPDTLRTLVP